MDLLWETAGHWDINSALRSTLALLSRSPARLHVGPRSGDVQSVDINSLHKSADGVIAGPPCPPFASIGKELSVLGSRSSVFVAICKWISYLAEHGRLSFFILENVAWILTKRKAESRSFADWLVDELCHDLPDGWSIQIVPHSSAKCLLPQSRPRVLFVGTAPCLRSTRRLRRIVG